MSASLRCARVDVHARFDASAQDVDWVRREIGGVDLSDKRLDRRAVKVMEQLAKSPTAPINEACGDWASTQAAYRLFNNPKATPQALIEPHIEATVQRMGACPSPVLVLQDTVFFSYGTHPKTRGLGPIGESNEVGNRGLIMHNALALTTAGVPLGLLSQNIWARKEVPEGEGYQEKIERLQCMAIDEKESAKWLLALRETVARTPRGVTVITVADRESDFFEFLTQATELRANFLIRARTDRRLIFEDSAGAASMIEALANVQALGKLSVQIPGNGSRRARTAHLEVRTARVTIMPPQRRGKAKISGSSEPITVNLIGATEHAPPAGIEAVSWVLLSNRPVPDFAAAAENIEWYGKRWSIETWHKVLKSGCKVEDCLLEEATRLQRYLTLFSIIAVRLMHVTYRSRAQPEAPATEVFSPEEIEALHVRVHKKLPPAEPPTLRDTVRLVGRLGGHLGRKGDGEPGVTVLWRGWLRLYEDVEILRAHKQALGLSSS